MKKLVDDENIEPFAYIGSIVFLIAGIVLLGVDFNVWAVITGVILVFLAWALIGKASYTTGKREGRLEERKKPRI